ncbi:MAG: hypothetical protein ACM3UZ_00550 [Acidobacteriota bacterium]
MDTLQLANGSPAVTTEWSSSFRATKERQNIIPANQRVLCEGKGQSKAHPKDKTNKKSSLNVNGSPAVTTKWSSSFNDNQGAA